MNKKSYQIQDLLDKESEPCVFDISLPLLDHGEMPEAMLLKNDFSPKAVSKLMGHAKEIISVDVYGDNANIIPDEIPELLEFMDEVLPKEAEGETDRLLDVVADTSCYLGA